jgi:hypothetical protein
MGKQSVRRAAPELSGDEYIGINDRSHAAPRARLTGLRVAGVRRGRLLLRR